jgi:hypothetical protein
MLGSIFVAFLLSGVKYMFGAILCLGAFKNHAFGFMVSSAGAVAGIFLFTYGESWLNEHVFKKYLFKKGTRFNKRNRFLVRLKHNGGLPLIALLTPVLLTIPVGCILATTFIHSRKKIILYMTISALFWGFLFFGGPWLLGINFAEWIEKI